MWARGRQQGVAVFGWASGFELLVDLLKHLALERLPNLAKLDSVASGIEPVFRVEGPHRNLKH